MLLLRYVKNIYTIFLLIILFEFSANAQIKSIGVPFIKNYKKSEYNAATQNWDIVQDERGVLFFANNRGVLEFDGLTWRLHPMNNQSIPRCLHIGKDGKIWVGAYNEFGYLKLDEKGAYNYHSIRNLVPKPYQNFGEFWKIHETSNGIYFQAFDILLFYDYNTITVIENYRDYVFSFYTNNRLFIQEKTKGLLELRGEKLYLIEGGEKFKGEIEVWQMLPLSIDSILIATQHHGLFLYDGYKVQSYDFKLNNYLIENQIYSLEFIHNKYLAFGTIQAGLLITDLKGNLIQHIDKAKGLQNNTVLSLFEDRCGQIWLGLDNGIDYVEINSAFSSISDPFGVEGTGYVSTIYNENLYLGTNQGLYYKNWNDLQINQLSQEKFKLVDNTIGQVWSLDTIDNQLLCGHNNGTFLLSENSINKISDEKGGWTYLKPYPNKDLVIGGTFTNLVIYKKNQQNNWAFFKGIEGLHESCRMLEMDSLNNLWISHSGKGVYKIRLTDDFEKIVSSRLYTAKDGLPSDIENFLTKLDGKVIICANKGIYEYNYATDKFESSARFNSIFGENNKIRTPQKDKNGSIWFYKNNHPALLQKVEQGYELIESPFLKYEGIFVNEFENLEVVDNQNVIFGTEKGFLHFNPQLIDTSYNEFYTIIRSVKTTKPNDSIIYYGNGKLTADTENAAKKISIPFRMNALKFSFTAPFYESPGRTQYRFRLLGFEKNWSDWQSSTEKEYTNLSPGDYTFIVESKNIYGRKGTQSYYHFTISPPWYATYWAFGAYLIVLVLMIYVSFKYLIYRFERAKQALKQREREKLKIKEAEFAKENMLQEQKIIKLKNENLEAEVLQKKTEMELKNKELASSAIQITHKNEILSNLKSRIESISHKVNNQAQLELRQLIKAIDEDLKLDEDWEQFKMHFEEVHSDFFKRLRNNYVELTPKDLKLCAYLRMNLSTKEIAPLMSISVRGVEISRYRLRKKLGLEKDANLIEFMLNI